MKNSTTRFLKLMDEPLVCVLASDLNCTSGISLCLQEENEYVSSVAECNFAAPDHRRIVTAILEEVSG